MKMFAFTIIILFLKSVNDGVKFTRKELKSTRWAILGQYNVLGVTLDIYNSIFVH